jgi:outer membrane protein assembly factor BamB
MKIEAFFSFVIILFLLTSAFPISALYGTVNSLGSLGVLGSQSTGDPTDWWQMFHHDVWHTGYSTSMAPNTNQSLWNYTTGNYVYSSPAIVDGVVYVGSYDGKVYALNATTGVQVWNYTASIGGVYSSPAVAGGVVYVGSHSAGNVYALNATTGAQVWN